MCLRLAKVWKLPEGIADHFMALLPASDDDC